MKIPVTKFSYFLILIMTTVSGSGWLEIQQDEFFYQLPRNWIELKKVHEKYFNFFPCEEYYDPEDDEMGGFIISSKAELLHRKKLGLTTSTLWLLVKDSGSGSSR